MNSQFFKNETVESINKGILFYTNIIKNDGVHHYTLSIDSSELIDNEVIVGEKTRKYDLPESLKVSFFRPFDSLYESINKKPCLYFFEFETGFSEKIFNAYKYYIINNPERNKSGLKNNPIFDTNILYLGKVKKGVGSRISTHFGYANPKTGGLQLKYWAKNLELKLKVHIIVFDENIGDFVNPLELELTKRLKPLIGKSK